MARLRTPEGHQAYWNEPLDGIVFVEADGRRYRIDPPDLDDIVRRIEAGEPVPPATRRYEGRPD